MTKRIVSDRASRAAGETGNRSRGLRRFGRALLWISGGVALCLVALGLLLLFAAYTTPGARLVISQAQRLGMPLTVNAVDGRLVGPLELRGLELATPGAHLAVDTLGFDWVPGELLFGRRVHIEKLTGAGVELAISSKREATSTAGRASADTASSPLRLPLRIVVDSGRIESFRASLPGEIRVESGRLTLSGNDRDYQLAAVGRIAAPRLHKARFQLVASGNLDSLDFEDVRIDLPAGTVTAGGMFAWYPAVRWSGRLDAHDVDPSRYLPGSSQWPGRLHLKARSSGRLTARGFVTDILVDTAYGSLRGRRLAGYASLDLTPRRIDVASLNFDWGSAQLEAAGAISESLNLDAHLEIPDLSLAIPDASGAVQLTGGVSGSRSAPRIEARFWGEAIELDENRLERITGQASVGLNEADSVRLSVRVSDAVWRRRTADSLSIEIEGTRAEHRLALAVESGEIELGLAAAGGLQEPDTMDPPDVFPGRLVWRGSLQRLQLQHRRAGEWELEETAADLLVARNEVSLGRELCLESSGSSVCLSGAWRDEAPWSARASVRDFPLALSEPFLPGSWSLGGELDGTLQVAADDDGQLRVQARLQPGPGRLEYRPGGLGSEVRYERGTLELATSSDGLLASLDFVLLDMDGDSAGQVRGRLELPGYEGGFPPPDRQTLMGAAGLRLTDLEALEALAPQLEHLRGTLSLELKAEGTVGSPAILGEASLTNGALDVPVLGLELRDLDVDATGEPDGRIDFEGGLLSGENRLRFRGDSRLLPSIETPSRLELEGERIVAMDTDQARIEVSPKLELEFDGDILRIDGEVVVDTADIRLGEADPVVEVSPDVVFVDSAAAEPETEISAQVRVALARPVSVSGFGFDGRLSGNVSIIESPKETTRGSGELVVEQGEYSALGQTLTIEEGRLIFAGGPIDNPGLDILATRTTDEVKVGMVITGTAKAPLVTLYSEPPLPQDRIVVILATGGTLEEQQGPREDLLQSATEKLGLKGASYLVRQIAAELELAEARVERGGSLGEASLIAGKYLSPSLYVEYGLSLMDPLRRLQLRYILSSKWTLVAETGGESGLDLLYRIETEF